MSVLLPNLYLFLLYLHTRKPKMKEEKTMLELVRRYEAYPLSAAERFGVGLTMAFFLSMALLFFVLPNIF